MTNNTTNTQDFLIRGGDYLAKQPHFELVGRDSELNKITRALMRKKANNVLMVGNGGVGCSAIAMGLQASKSDPDAPFDIVSKRNFWLDSDGLFSSGDPAIINEAFQKTLKTLSSASDAVLHLDDFKDFIDAARSNGCPNLINGLMRALKQGKFQAVLEVREEDMETVLKCHSDMRESFTMIDITEPSAEALNDIIEKVAQGRLETHHKIKISETAIATAIDLTNKYRVRDLGLSRAQPERAITLLDRALTSYRQDAHAKDPKLTALEERIGNIFKAVQGEGYAAELEGKSQEELESLLQVLEAEALEIKNDWDSRQTEIKKVYKDLATAEENIRSFEDALEAQLEEEAEARKRAEEAEEEAPISERRRSFDVAATLQKGGFESEKVEQMRARIRQYKDGAEKAKIKFEELTADINSALELEETHVLSEFSRISGVPTDKLTQDERLKLMNLDTSLGNRVFGQPEAVTKLSDQVIVSRAGLQDKSKPQAAFMFLGPSGVGKTEITKALADQLEMSLLRFDMSEYMEKHAVAKLIGAPPGYEGYEAGGILTNSVRRNPRQIILLDEIEKAHPDVFDVLLQVLDDARLTDNRGLTVNFNEAIIILTSNEGTPHFLNEDISFDESKDLAMEDLEQKFRPEFLNRFNGRENILCFNKLGLPVIEKIARRELGKINQMIKDNGKAIDIAMTDEDLATMCADHYKPVNGARGITGYIQGKIKPSVAKATLFTPDAEGTMTIEYDAEEQTVKVNAPKKAAENPASENETLKRPANEFATPSNS
jgi:ATP-dependent Clp protease ATP-binding subunit ClpB